MKNKWKWVYNPFEFIAGWKAFGIGIVILCITTIAGYFGNTVFYGLSIKTVPYITWSMAFSLQTLGLAVLVVLMYVAALLFAKQVRFQDILGTVTLAKYPLILSAIVFLVFSKWLIAFSDKLMSINIYEMINKITPSDYVLLLVFSMLLLPVIVWEIVLLFNAFRVSTNLKGVKCVLLFVTTLLISEIIIMIIVFLINIRK